MTEETRESYDSGEVVWVKLGSSWWPGEVKNAEELPSDVLDFKKPPLAIVKFFDEDSYEYVKSWASIYPYECDKKIEFIKKGMAAFRAKVPHMDKFPKDVLQAEDKVGGNPNILSSPMFLPEKKRNYAAEIFGTPGPKTNTPKNKKRSSTNKSSKKDTSHITHRRFLGVDDYRAYICIQYPGKDRIPGDKEDEEVIRINREPEQDFNCHSCSFSTKRLEVMILHTKSHIHGVYQCTSRRGKQAAPRRRKEKSKRARGSDVVDSDSTTSDSEPFRQKKRKPKSQGTKKTKIKKIEEEEQKKKDIRSELLEAWEDSDEDTDLDFSLANLQSSATEAEKTSKILDGTSSEPVPELTVEDSLNKSDVTDTLDGSEAPDQNDSTQTEATAGLERADGVKSPSQTIEEALNDVSGELDDSSTQSELVQPAEEQLSTEKLLSTLEDDSLDADEEVRAIDDKKEVADAQRAETPSNKIDEEMSGDEAAAKKSDADEDASKQKKNFDVLEAIKSCFDFDEDDEDDTTMVGKATSGRKIPRVIPKTSRKNSETDNMDPGKDESGKEKDKGHEDIDAAFKELMEITSVPDLPEVQNSLKCEQNFHNIKTIKFPDKTEQVGSPPKPERKDSTEVATKLTNPKKRFVKSFEDFELMQNEIRRREEEQLEMSKNEETTTGPFGSTSNPDYLDNSDDQYSPDSHIELSKLKSKIMSKIIEEAKINPVSKSKIMSKIHDPKHKTAESELKPKTVEQDTKTAKAQEKAASSHRTPRSKILESYRKDTSKSEEKRETSPPEAQKEETGSANTEEALPSKPKVDQADVTVPPKKHMWSRRGSHPKKDKNLPTFEPIESSKEPSKTSDVVVDEPEPEPEPEPKPETAPTNEDTSTNEVVEEEDKTETEKREGVEPQPEPAPAQDEESSTNSIPSNETAEELPSSKEETEEKDKKSPVEQSETLNEPENSHQESNEVAVEANIDLTEEGSEKTPQIEEPVPEEEDKTTTKEEEGNRTEEARCLSPESFSPRPSTEEPCAKDEISPSTAEDASDVPLESDVGNETSAEKVVIPEDQIMEEEEEVKCHADVPEEELVASPKSRKRKMSDDEPNVSPANTDSDLQSDSFPSPKKRMNEAEAATPPFESTPSQGDKEVTEEIEKMDKETTEESDKEIKAGVEVPTQMEPEKEFEGTGESDKDPSSETKIIEDCEEKKPESAEPTQEDAGIKPEEETDLAGLETEAIPEKPSDPESNKAPDPSLQDHNNEVEIHCASNSVDSFKFSIQTNLSILSSREEMSALALATLSEMKADLESNEEAIPKEEEEAEPEPPVHHQSEMVPIEGNLTVVSEKDLADGQVEITSEQVISPKRPATLSNFSLDFSDSFSDSNSNSTTDTSTDLGKGDFNSKGTEFTAKALTKQMKKLEHKKESTYGRLELINILEGNSDTERKAKEYVHPLKKPSTVDDIWDFEEHIPSQIVCAKNLKKDSSVSLEQELKEFKVKEKTSKTSVKSTTSKLLERLTTESKAKASAIASESSASEAKTAPKEQTVTIATPRNIKYTVKSRPSAAVGASKPIILSEKVVKPPPEAKPKPKKAMEDIEDVEAFVIHKDPNKIHFDEEETKSKTATTTKTAGKAKILQQTIITPAGEIIQPTLAEVQTDDNIFDINSMPIVLSDEIFTPESIEKMPIVIGSDAKVNVTEKLVKRPASGRLMTTVVAPELTTPNKTVTVAKHKPPRILQGLGNKTAKNSPLLPNTAKAGKYIIVPQSSIPPTKYVSKKPTLIKKTPVPTSVVQKMPNIAPEPSGNKIMIVTNQQGQQQRLLLTPAQQKMLGYQSPKVTKTIVKGNVMQKSVLAAKGVSLEAGTSGLVSKTPSLMGQKVLVGTNTNQTLITATGQVMAAQGRMAKSGTKRTLAGIQKPAAAAGKPQKTILIKNQHGQTVRKIQGTDDELLDKQVAEQLKAIKASSGMKFSLQQNFAESDKSTVKNARRSYSKRVEVKPRGPPPLAMQQSSKQETLVSMPTLASSKKTDSPEAKPPSLLKEETKAQQPDRPLNQLVIQDAVGNQTTITEGQILALPSETVDGQPQSYMLVTLDESGNLTPLNSEALMSLDPNLGLGGDLSNMVLQIDQSALTDRPQTAIIKPSEIARPPKAVEVEPIPQPVPEPEICESVPEQKAVPTPESLQPATPSTNGDPGQQLIVTGDPVATQKFLESLTEGTTDLANILANADGNSILIQADGQQILINTNTDNQMLVSVNNDNVNATESTEGGGNPIFATQPSKNQDILAAALADTDVFQQEHPSSTPSKIGSQLSPNNALYPMNVGSVLETSLTLSSPIMTPLEVPSTNNKKIPDDEADILTQVPKNVDLPITITDPNISQTVANQQMSQMIANELHTNLELALPISETTISAVSTEMNSPSYVYSLPALDDPVEMTQKPFNGSMPLLNEDVEDATDKRKPEPETRKPEIGAEGFLAEEEGRFTLGGEMCSSLSEPPPEMFELPEVGQGFAEKGVPSLQSTPDVSDNASKDEDTTDLSQADTSSEGSCEIPVQPQIVTKSLDLSRNLDSLKRGLGEAEGDNKKCKFD